MLELLLLQYKEIFGTVTSAMILVSKCLAGEPCRFDGSFTGTRVAGNGIFVQTLPDVGVSVMTEEEYREKNNCAGW